MRRRLFPLYAALRSAPPPSPVVPEISVAPVIDSSAGNSVGDEISVDDGTWANGPILEYAYRPTRDAAPIAGETASTYTLAQPADPGKSIGYQVRARNAAGWSSWATATGAVVCRPYWTAAPTFSGTNAVGNTFTGSNGTVLGSTSTTYQWVRAAVETADSDPWPIVVGDEGLAFIWRGTGSNAGGDTDSDSTAMTVRPYNSAVPTISGTNTVGSTLTGAQGTWAGEDSLANMWVVGGVDSGDTDTSYTVGAGDAGETIVFEVTGTNAGGDTVAVSTTMTIRPYWSANPSLLAVENWPGGTVTVTPGTVSGETSGPTGEWLVDLTGTGDTDTSYTPTGSDVGKDLLYRESASNAGGASTADSDSIEIVQIEGVQRAGEGDDWLTNSTTGIPANCTILVEMIGISASSSGTVVSIGRQSGGSPTRRELGLLLPPSGTYVQGIFRNGTSLGIITLSGLTNLLDGSTRHIIAVDQASGSSAGRVAHMPPGGTATSTTTFSSGTYQNPAAGGITDQAPAIFRRGAALVAGGVPVTEFAGILSVAVLNRRLDTTDYQDIADAGSLQAWGAFSDPDLRWSLRPDPAQSEGTALTNASTQLDGATYTIQGGTSDCTLGGLNEAA